MDSQPSKTIKLFYCYAREDKLWRDELEKHLGVLRRQGIIASWYDQEIRAGQEWEAEINANLEAADIVLLLVSPDFVNSDYCYSTEMQHALERHARGEVYVVPVILRSVYWEGAPFSHLQVLPTDGKPVHSAFWHNLDDAFANIVSNLRKVINTLNMAATCAPQTQPLQTSTIFSSIQQPIQNLIVAGNVFFERKDYEEALIAYEKATEINSREVRAYKGKGKVLCSLKRYEEALTAYKQAVRLDFNDTEAYVGKGDALIGLQHYEDALAAYEQALHLAPDDIELGITKGNVLHILNRNAEALTWYEQLGLRIPNDARIYTGKAKSFLRLKCYEDALAAYEQAIQTDPNNADAYFDKGLLLGGHIFERYKDALVAYDEAVRLEPTHSLFWICRGRTLTKLRRYEEALIAYKEALEVANTDFYDRGEAQKGQQEVLQLIRDAEKR
jgi:tetratricopeptide (TPR) repeat protein